MILKRYCIDCGKIEPPEGQKCCPDSRVYWVEKEACEKLNEMERQRGKTLDELRVERDRYMRALVHIRANAESQLRAFETCARIAGEFVETPEFINARWNYTEANAAMSA